MCLKFSYRVKCDFSFFENNELEYCKPYVEHNEQKY